MAIALFDKESGRRLFTVTAAQLEQLTEALEEEGANDHDYYIDAAVCDFLDGKIDEEVVAGLRQAIGAPPPPDEAGEAIEAAGEDEAPPEIEPGDDDDDDDDDDDGTGMEIEWREE